MSAAPAPAPHRHARRAAAADDQPAHVAAGPDAAILARIRERGITLSIWTLDPLPELRPAVQALEGVDLPPDRSVAGTPDQVAADLHALLGAAPGNAWAQPLLVHLRTLVAIFAAVSGADRVAARLRAIEGNACRRFHADYVDLRLITTLCGPGTEWLPDAAVDRCCALRADWQPEPETIRRIAPLHVAIMKGQLAPGALGRALMHRSPPIAGTGARRLVFSLDRATS